MDWGHLFSDTGVVIVERAHLAARGVSARAITDAVRSHELIRVRRGHYALPGTPAPVLEAVRVGGRLACTSALEAAGVFVFESSFTHVHLERPSSRHRAPRDSTKRFTQQNRDGCELHWRPLTDPAAAPAHVVGPVDAMIQAIRCQAPWMAVASLDSALRSGYVREHELSEIFAALPRRLRRLRRLVDRRSESGIETILRLMLIEAGLEFDLQVRIPRVGRVDFVVAGRLVIETDGRGFHGPATAERDYARDLELTAQGYWVLRLDYRQVMFQKAAVMAAISGALAVLDVHNSGRMGANAL
ncbi:MAG: hypothetical protein RI885_1396 [Actinomycetota bacterium]|jgi:very-short-patch-repair endonuclease